MRRADRLFQLVQKLRARRLTTAAELARDLEVSERTIYRDIQDLMKSGVPIEGEAGVGYTLPPGFDLPPLMFDEEELEVLVLGVRILTTWGGESFAPRAKSVLEKVEGVLPERLRERFSAIDLYAPDHHVPEEVTRNLEALTKALREKKRISMVYQTDRETTMRTIRPLGLYFWGSGWTMLGWCELRSDFRNFRPDRMSKIEVDSTPFEDEPGRDLETFLKIIHQKK